MALNPRANQYTGPTYSAKVFFYGGWRHNYYCQQRKAGWANEGSTSLDVHGKFMFTAWSEIKYLAT